MQKVINLLKQFSLQCQEVADPVFQSKQSSFDHPSASFIWLQKILLKLPLVSVMEMTTPPPRGSLVLGPQDPLHDCSVSSALYFQFSSHFLPALVSLWGFCLILLQSLMISPISPHIYSALVQRVTVFSPPIIKPN